jgi:hypothetical protein
VEAAGVGPSSQYNAFISKSLQAITCYLARSKGQFRDNFKRVTYAPIETQFDVRTLFRQAVLISAEAF